jgi:hypothetical protein
LGYAALEENDDVIGNRHRLLLVVSDQQGCRSSSAQNGYDVLADVMAHRRIEGREWFVEKNETRARGKRASEGDSLPLPSGDFPRATFAKTFEADEMNQLFDSTGLFAVTHFELACGNTESNIPLDAEVREESTVLRYVTDPSAVRRYDRMGVADQCRVDQDLSCIGLVEARNQTQQRRLSVSGRSKNCGDSPRRCTERDVVENFDITERLRHIDEIERCCTGGTGID